jgi:hypothetical protein
MGWDPSVELVERAEGSFYHIMVGDTQYKTLKFCKIMEPTVLLSRAARIFKVKKVGDPEDNIYVLKDLWLEKDRKPEHQIYEEIISDVGRLYPEQVDIVRQHLFTPVRLCVCRGQWCQGRYENEYDAQQDIGILQGGPTADTMRYVRAPDKTCHRMHYRIVFKEYATPLHKVKKMGEVFAVLADLMECQSFDSFAMAKTHSFFQLQCFVSFTGVDGCIETSVLGNVYLYEGHGVLGDLEFAKNTADNTQHELRIVRGMYFLSITSTYDLQQGTIDFTPIETIAQNSFLDLIQELRSVAPQSLLFVITPSMTLNQLGGLVFGRCISSGPKVTKNQAKPQSYARTKRKQYSLELSPIK